MKKVFCFSVIALLISSYAFAGWGYCHSCRCNKFDRDYFNGDSSNWYCKCGDRYEDHLNASRPNNTSFGARTVYYEGTPVQQQGFFDKGENVFYTILSVLAIVYGFATKKWSSAAVGIPIIWLIKALLK